VRLLLKKLRLSHFSLTNSAKRTGNRHGHLSRGVVSKENTVKRGGRTRGSSMPLTEVGEGFKNPLTV